MDNVLLRALTTATQSNRVDENIPVQSNSRQLAVEGMKELRLRKLGENEMIIEVIPETQVDYRGTDRLVRETLTKPRDDSGVLELVSFGGQQDLPTVMAFLNRLGFQGRVVVHTAPFVPKTGSFPWGRDLTALAHVGKLLNNPVIGRDDEVDDMLITLSQKRKNNVLMIGETGVGKTTVVEQLANRVVLGAVPETLRGFQVQEIGLGELLAGASMKGELEARFQKIIKQAAEIKTSIVFFDEMHMIFHHDFGIAAQMLKPALARGEFRVIGATTAAEYRQFIKHDEAFCRRFRLLTINEPTPKETVRILRGITPQFEKAHGVKINADLLPVIVAYAVRFLPQKRLPDKAIDVLDLACARLINRKLIKGTPRQTKGGE